MVEGNNLLMSSIEAATTACRNTTPEIAQHADRINRILVTEVEQCGDEYGVHLQLGYLAQRSN